MPKSFYQNRISVDENLDIKRLSKAQHIGERQVVDINKLLNRVKIHKKNETKKKIIFYSFVVTVLSLLGTIIVFLK